MQLCQQQKRGDPELRGIPMSLGSDLLPHSQCVISVAGVSVEPKNERINWPRTVALINGNASMTVTGRFQYDIHVFMTVLFMSKPE